MNELTTALKQCIANTFVMYYKAHSYHWNIEGIYFNEFHGFFGTLYEELHAAVDPMAEELRALGDYAPKTLSELYTFASAIETPLVGAQVESMVNSLLVTNGTVLTCLNKTFDLATTEKKQGLANFLADRIDVHEKHGWMLRSILKGNGQ